MPVQIKVDVISKTNEEAMRALFQDSFAKPTFVDVGIFQGAGSTEKMPIASIAAVHEFGARIPVTDRMRRYLGAALGLHLRKETTHITIPERSFIRSAMMLGKERINERLRQDLVAFISGKTSRRTVFSRVGLLAANLIQARIRSSRSWAAPLSPVTIAKKGSSVPLIDTGRLIASVTYRIDGETAKT